MNEEAYKQIQEKLDKLWTEISQSDEKMDWLDDFIVDLGYTGTQLEKVFENDIIKQYGSHVNVADNDIYIIDILENFDYYDSQFEQWKIKNGYFSINFDWIEMENIPKLFEEYLKMFD